MDTVHSALKPVFNSRVPRLSCSSEIGDLVILVISIFLVVPLSGGPVHCLTFLAATHDLSCGWSWLVLHVDGRRLLR